MLNITRVYNSLMAVSYMRRILQLSHDYAERRTAFGQKISEKPIFIQVMQEQEMAQRGSLLQFLETAHIL